MRLLSIMIVLFGRCYTLMAALRQLCLTDLTQGESLSYPRTGAWPTVHRLAIFRQPVVVSLLTTQASCVQHLRPLSTIGVKTSHIERLKTYVRVIVAGSTLFLSRRHGRGILQHCRRLGRHGR